MHITHKRVNPYTIEVEVKDSAVELEKSRKMVLDKIRAEGKIPGFMKGSQIPEEAILRHYGEPVIMDRAFTHYLEKTYPRILRKFDVIPVASWNIKEVKSMNPLEFSVTIEILPDIEIDTRVLKDIHVKRTLIEVKDSEVDEEIHAIEKRFTHYHHIGEHTHDGADTSHESAERGDRVTIDAQGYEKNGGEAIPETRVPSYPLILGSNSFIPWFEEKLIGAKEAETVEFDITFPSDYHSEKFRSQNIYFIVKIEKIEQAHTPEWSESFIEWLRGKKTDLAGFRQILHDEIREKKEMNARMQDEQKLLEELLKVVNVEVGPTLIEQETDQVLREQKWRMEEQGLTLKDYLHHVNMSEESYKLEVLKPEAERRLKWELILKKLHTILGIDVTNEEVQREVDTLIAKYSKPEVIARLHEKLVEWDPTYEELKSRLIYRKVIDSFFVE